MSEQADTTETTETEKQAAKPGFLQGIKDWGKRNQAQIGLTVLVIYVALLALGTIGEVWDIEWILDLPLFRPPGRP